MIENSFAQPKEMIFAWCKDGAHDKCRTQYGVGRIVCICDCGDVHGTNYTAINKTMTESEVNTSIESINMIMTGDAGDGVSENRAVRSDSSVWGDQVKEGNTIGTRGVTHYNAAKVSVSGPGTTSKYYEYPEALDAKNIQELEERRGNRKLGSYDYTDFNQWL